MTRGFEPNIAIEASVSILEMAEAMGLDTAILKRVRDEGDSIIPEIADDLDGLLGAPLGWTMRLHENAERDRVRIESMASTQRENASIEEAEINT